MAKDPIKKADNGTYYFRLIWATIPLPENRYRNTEVASERKKKQRKNIQNWC